MSLCLTIFAFDSEWLLSAIQQDISTNLGSLECTFEDFELLHCGSDAMSFVKVLDNSQFWA